MFSSKAKLERVGFGRQGRFEYLQALVTEFQDTHKQEYKLQVLANLANFAYDPINYDFLRQLNVLDLFLDVIAEEKDEKMIEFAMGGICNCCVDVLNRDHLLSSDCLDLTIKCLSSPNEETVLSAVTTLVYLTTLETKKITTTVAVVGLMQQFATSSNVRLRNLATIFLQDHCQNCTG